MKSLISFALILFAHSGLSQGWQSQYEQSVSFYNNFQLNEARESAEKALELFVAENPDPHKNVATINRQLALICYELNDLDAAVSFAADEIETLNSLSLNADMNYSAALSNLALIRSARSEYVESEKLLDQALLIARQYNSDESEEVAIINGNLAIAKFQLRKDSEAEALFAKSLNVLRRMQELPFDYFNIVYNYSLLKAEQSDYQTALKGFEELAGYYEYDAPNFEYASILTVIGDAYDQLGQFTSAVDNYRKAISNFEQIGEQGSDEYAIAQNQLSIDLQKTGQFEEAEQLVKSVLDRRTANKSDNPAGFAATAFNYANLLKMRGNVEEAEDYFSQAIDAFVDYPVDQNITYVNALNSRSQIRLSRGDISPASSDVDLAISTAESLSINQTLHSLYNQKAKVLSRQGKYSEAKSFGEKALSQVNSTYGGGSIQAAFVSNSLAEIFSTLGDYDKANELYLASLPVFEQFYGHDHPEYATSAANYSSLLQLMGNYYSAEVYLADAVNIKKAAFGKENLDFLTTYENLGLLYLTTARYTDAHRVLGEVESIKKAVVSESDPSLAYTYSNLALLKKQMAEYTEAERFFRDAVRIYETSVGKSHLLYASTINNLALLYQKMGNTPAAKPLFEEAMKVYEEKLGKQSPDYSTALANLATLYQMEDKSDRAKELFEEALEIDRQLLGEDHPLYSKTLNNLATLYQEDEEYDRAKELYEQSLQINENIFGTRHPSYASTLYNLAVLEQELENYDQAKLHYEQVADIRLEILGENHPDYAYSIYGLASISQKTGDFESARENYLIVVNKYLENIQEYFPALSENEKSAFYAKIKPVFEAFMDFSIEYVITEQGSEQDRAEMLSQLYNLQLSTKALLLNATNKVRNRILNSGDEDLISLFNEWIALKENIVKSYALTKEEIAQNNIDIPAMEEQSNDMEKQLSLKSSAFAQEFEKESISWEDVRDALSEQDAAIEIIRIRKNLKNDSILYATLIVEYGQETSPSLVLISNGDVLEEKGFKTYKNSIVFKVADKKSYGLFWQDINEGIHKKTKNIYLSADGVFNKVNISTLLDGKEYVVEKYNIRLLSNTKELVSGDEGSNPVNSAEIFGYPKYNLQKEDMGNAGNVVDEGGMRYSFGDKVAELPGTLEELNNISSIMDKKAWSYNAYTETLATETSIKQLNSPKIFHVATHGFFLEDKKVKEDENEGLSSRSMKYNPLMRSGLLFAGAENTIRDEKIPGEDDGILTAYEAMNLNLDNTDIVVMSACETGLGEVKNGEGVYGLQRAFIVAGAQNLIMSLWKVNDATTQLLMSTFYNEWFSGKSKTDAFNAAIQKVKKDYDNPYYWGAFVMLGK